MGQFSVEICHLVGQFSMKLNSLAGQQHQGRLHRHHRGRWRRALDRAAIRRPGGRQTELTDKSGAVRSVAVRYHVSGRDLGTITQCAARFSRAIR